MPNSKRKQPTVDAMAEPVQKKAKKSKVDKGEFLKPYPISCPMPHSLQSTCTLHLPAFQPQLLASVLFGFGPAAEWGYLAVAHSRRSLPHVTSRHVSQKRPELTTSYKPTYLRFTPISPPTHIHSFPTVQPIPTAPSPPHRVRLLDYQATALTACDASFLHFSAKDCDSAIRQHHHNRQKQCRKGVEAT